jgi:two-component system nitrate/nitrite response regulator NarL
MLNQSIRTRQQQMALHGAPAARHLSRPIWVKTRPAFLGRVVLVEVGPRQAVGEPTSLTKRQLEILRLLAEGMSTGQIATELGLSQTTVRNYIASLLAALGVHSRLQAVVAAKRAELLDS